MPCLHLDCSHGLGGDMFLAALADLGLDLAPLQAMLDAAGVDARLDNFAIRRRGLVGRRIEVRSIKAQPLRHLHDLTDILERLDLSDAVKARSRKAFGRLAEVEAQAHGVGPDEVHFHEVGAVDTLVDVVGAFWGLERLGVGRVTSGPLPWFQGEVECAHGRLPLPAPATARLMQGKPVRATDICFECVTPTGALLVDQIVEAFTAGPNGLFLAQGHAYGAREEGDGLRAYLYDPEARDETGDAAEEVVVLTTNLDHLTGEELGACFGPLLEAGALDVIHLPGTMKKNRPGGQMQVMCAPEDLDRVQAAVFRHTLSLGLRRSRVERVALARRPATLASPLGELEAKAFVVDGRELLRVEHEAMARLARETGRSVAELRLLLCGTPADETP